MSSQNFLSTAECNLKFQMKVFLEDVALKKKELTEPANDTEKMVLLYYAILHHNVELMEQYGSIVQKMNFPGIWRNSFIEKFAKVLKNNSAVLQFICPHMPDFMFKSVDFSVLKSALPVKKPNYYWVKSKLTPKMLVKYYPQMIQDHAMNSRDYQGMIKIQEFNIFDNSLFNQFNSEIIAAREFYQNQERRKKILDLERKIFYASDTVDFLKWNIIYLMPFDDSPRDVLAEQIFGIVLDYYRAKKHRLKKLLSTL